MRHLSRRGTVFSAALVALALAGCANQLLDEARSRQSEAVAPRIYIAYPEGDQLSHGGSLDFGQVSIGASRGFALAIRNDGARDLTLSADALSIDGGSGTFAAEAFSGLTLAKGEQGSIGLRFTPPAAESFSASLSIASNDGQMPVFVIGLSGSGSATAKALTGFGILDPPVVGAIDEAAKSVALELPPTTDLSALVPTFETTGVRVLVGGAVQVSGASVRDFTNPVTYRVEAQDGSIAEYVVTASLATIAPILGKVTFSSVTTNSAAGSSSVASSGDGEAEVAECGVCWSTSANPTSSGLHAASSSKSGSFSDTVLAGLSAGTLYYVRAYATNKAGLTGYGEQATFSTLPSQPTGVSAASVGYAAGADKLTVSWSAATGASSYDVYASQSATAPTAVTSPSSGGVDVTATSCTLTGLETYKTYYVWARAKNSSGAGAWSGSASRQVGIPVTGVSLSFDRGTMDVPLDGSLAVSVDLTPANATERAVNWIQGGSSSSFTVQEYASSASISTSSAATASMTLQATSRYGSGISSSAYPIATTVPRSSLSAEYLFAGGSLSDTSGASAGSATISSASAIADRLGTSSGAYTKAVSSAVDAMKLGALGNKWCNSSFSVSLWIWVAQAPSANTYPPIISQQASTNHGFQWDLYLDSSGRLHAYAGTYRSASNADIATASSVANSSWRHVAYVQNGTAVSLYVDGSFVGSASHQSGSTATDDVKLQIGYINGANNPIYGLRWTGEGTAFAFDDVRVYGKALSANEVLSLYRH